ncbi:MAG TPA: c-type cytochrome [Bacteroidota bacterium]
MRLTTFNAFVAGMLLIMPQESIRQQTETGSLKWGLLIPDTATMSQAWRVPHDPTTETQGLDKDRAAKILRGFRLFMNTAGESSRFTGGAMSCNNCHPNGGQREKALPLVGVDLAFPEYNKRAGRDFSLEERIIGCLMRSVNATGTKNQGVLLRHENELSGATLTAESEETQSLAAYIRWLSVGRTIPTDIPWRGHNTLPSSALIPISKLDTKLGQQLYTENCSSCHGTDGQGVAIGDKKPGPLWGPNSWNDGAGAARTYTLAGMIRNWMPYLHPGKLSDEEAQHIAAYITSKPRPQFPFKDKDYRKEKIPVDAVYYPQRYPTNPLVSGEPGTQPAQQ